MKGTVIALCAILAVTTAKVVINVEGQDTPHLLGSKACTWGPSYWCQNITTAAGCQGTKFCISNKWEKMQVPEDHDSVCQVCKDMVKQARDQLESNQTQEDLKAVFEGSCALMYIKPIVKECDVLVDQFIPELVETLASQMNPSVVCSVAGLCNSAHIDKLIQDHENKSGIKKLQAPLSLANDQYSPNECSKCYTIAHHMEHKFGQSSRDSVLERFLYMCGEFSSFSDACSSIILTNFDVIYSHLKNNFNAKNVCHLSGQCSDRFHVHEMEADKTPEVEIRPLSSVGMVEVGDDLPCKLCEQLVLHLKDLLVANTTEAEFEQVLEGLCKQTKSFANECKAIVDQYYPEIYSYLTKGLNGNVICQMGGICPAPGQKSEPVWLLIPETDAKTAEKMLKETVSETKMNKTKEMQLPRDKLIMPFGGLVVDDTYCSTCEFVLNFVKRNVRNLNDRNEVELVLSEMKTNLPSIEGQSTEENFLDKYEIALAELILQGKGFSEICSLVAVCPTKHQVAAWEQISSTISESSIQQKPTCKLCILAVSKLYSLVENDKTEASIEHALDKVCNELPKSLTDQCTHFVKIYSKELIKVLVDDMEPLDVCTSIKLCDPSEIKKSNLFIGQKIMAVPKNDVEGKKACALCEYILHYIQVSITNPKAEDEVKQVIDKVCSKLPNSIKNNCDEFIDTYGDAIVAIIAQQIDPSSICPMIHVCPSTELLDAWKQIPKDHVIISEKKDKPNCPLCLFGVTQIYDAIKDNKTEESIEAALDKLCTHLPKSLIDQCESLVTGYSKQIISMILDDLKPQDVCAYLKLCDSSKSIEPSISFFPLDKNGEIMTNEIPQGPAYTINTEQEVNEDAECVFCEFIMKYVQKTMSSPNAEKRIENIIHGVCNHLPLHMSDNCNKFVNNYAEIVIALLAQEVSPEEICVMIDICQSDASNIRESVTECALCQAVITSTEKLLGDRNVDKHVEEVVSKVCKYLPMSKQGKCTTMMGSYEQKIINLMKAHSDTSKICSKIALCSSNDFIVMLNKDANIGQRVRNKNVGMRPCTRGITYWCLNEKNAKECKATEFCKKKGHLLDSPAIA